MEEAVEKVVNGPGQVMQESMEYTDGEEKKVEAEKSPYLPGESEAMGKIRLDLLAQAEKYL